jgi:hypothetical protein
MLLSSIIYVMKIINKQFKTQLLTPFMNVLKKQVQNFSGIRSNLLLKKK